jgi:hypothetical protein
VANYAYGISVKTEGELYREPGQRYRMASERRMHVTTRGKVMKKRHETS